MMTTYADLDRVIIRPRRQSIAIEFQTPDSGRMARQSHGFHTMVIVGFQGPQTYGVVAAARHHPVFVQLHAGDASNNARGVYLVNRWDYSIRRVR